MSQPVDLPPPLIWQPSRWAWRSRVVLHGLAAALVLALPGWWWGAVWVGVACSWWLSRPQPWRSLQAQADGRVLIVEDVAPVLAEIRPSSRLTPWLLVLHLQAGDRKIALCLWPDSAGAQELRRWRVWLRWVWPQLIHQGQKQRGRDGGQGRG